MISIDSFTLSLHVRYSASKVTSGIEKRPQSTPTSDIYVTLTSTIQAVDVVAGFFSSLSLSLLSRVSFSCRNTYRIYLYAKKTDNERKRRRRKKKIAFIREPKERRRVCLLSLSLSLSPPSSLLSKAKRSRKKRKNNNNSINFFLCVCRSSPSPSPSPSLYLSC